MSWAAKRISKRVEDRAYSLMGLFDINMPMIYGKREKAFLRLQQQIVHQCKDESLFAWPMELGGDTASTYSGFYAPSPSVFVQSGQFETSHVTKAHPCNHLMITFPFSYRI
jgi:hypothetical protein